VVTFGYDALGRRVSRTVNGTTCQLVHDGDRIIVERQGGALTAVYSYGNALVARNGEVVLSDGLGTTRATVNGVQAITSTLTTEAFGNAVAQWGSSANPYRFAGAWGYRDDGDAGLLHVGARYYDPQVGRFISRDAVLSEHPYLYCEHEPVNSIDPTGRWNWFEAIKWGAATLIGGGIGFFIGGPWGSVIGATIGAFVAGGLEEGDIEAILEPKSPWFGPFPMLLPFDPRSPILIPLPQPPGGVLY
jgi:RHS repeat-associated protein